LWYNFHMWYLYILKCRDETLYVGITTDLTKRLKTHNQGKASRYTRMRLPVEMIYHELHPDKSSARKREIQVKKWPRPQKLALTTQSR
jgi:putative endonuclease